MLENILQSPVLCLPFVKVSKSRLLLTLCAIVFLELRRETNPGSLPSPAMGEDKENTEPLPPIPSVGSPYENVRLTPRGGRMSESPGASSPSQWNNFYDSQEDRRM